MVINKLENLPVPVLLQHRTDISKRGKNSEDREMLWNYQSLPVLFTCNDPWRRSMVADRLTTTLELENPSPRVPQLARLFHPRSPLFLSCSLTARSIPVYLFGLVNTATNHAFPTRLAQANQVSNRNGDNGKNDQDDSDEEEGEFDQDEGEEFPDEAEEEEDEFEIKEDEFNDDGDVNGLDEEEENEEFEGDDYDEEFEEDEGDDDLGEVDEDLDIDDDEYDDDEDDFEPDEALNTSTPSAQKRQSVSLQPTARLGILQFQSRSASEQSPLSSQYNEMYATRHELNRFVFYEERN